MTYFLLQTSLLLLGAFLVGAILGCLLRKMFARRRAQPIARAGAAVVAGAAAATAGGVAAQSYTREGDTEVTFRRREDEVPEPPVMTEPPAPEVDIAPPIVDAVELEPETVEIPPAPPEVEITPPPVDVAEPEPAQVEIRQTVEDPPVEPPAPEPEDIQVEERPAPPVQTEVRAEPDAAPVFTTPQIPETIVTETVPTVPEAPTPQPETTVDVRPDIPDTVATEVERTVAAHETADRDDLKRIMGVGTVIEQKLNNMGITRFAQIAGWQRADIDQANERLDFSGRIEREDWISQAKILAGGRETEFSRRIDSPHPDSGATVAGVAAAPIGQAIQTGAVPEGAAVSETRFQHDVRNDLKRIAGIGRVIEDRLNHHGVTRFEQIAAWTAEDIQKYNGILNFSGRIEREGWISQAEILASGGETEFSLRVKNQDVPTGGDNA